MVYSKTENALESAAGVGAGAKVDGELDFLIGHQVPAEAVEFVAFHSGDADALPTEPSGFPGQAFPAPRDHGVKADEEEQALRGEWEHFGDGLRSEERRVGKEG